MRRCSLQSRGLLVALIGAALGAGASADETDQYLTWGTELEDAAPALNLFINDAIQARLDTVNGDPFIECDCETLTGEIFASIYLDRFRPPLLEFLADTVVVDVHPPRDVRQEQLRGHSIYREIITPTIRMTRTLRVGDVYFGVDKLAHVFGIGRRYYTDYRRQRGAGMDAKAAERAAAERGFSVEDSVLGSWINGIFSYADLEANLQGLRLARDFCEGERPYVQHDGFQWVSPRQVDLRDYVTPFFDESFNPPFYNEDLRALIYPVIAAQYREAARSDAVAERFKRYRSVLDGAMLHLMLDPAERDAYQRQRNALLEALGLDPSHPAAPLDIYEYADAHR